MALITYQDIPNQNSSSYNTVANVLVAILNVLTGKTAGTSLASNYDVFTAVVTVNGSVAAGTYNSVEFFNQGDENIDVNGRIVYPGQSFTINGFPGETGQTALDYTFAGGGASPSLAVTIKTYL